MLRVLCHGGDRSDWGPVVSVLARRQNLDVVRSTRLGAFYWAAGLMPWVYFVIRATFAEFEADLIRMRTREGMAIARAKGKLRGKQPKLSDRQQRELCRMHATGEYSISDLAELFTVSRPTVYRTLNRRHSP